MSYLNQTTKPVIFDICVFVTLSQMTFELYLLDIAKVNWLEQDMPGMDDYGFQELLNRRSDGQTHKHLTNYSRRINGTAADCFPLLWQTHRLKLVQF